MLSGWRRGYEEYGRVNGGCPDPVYGGPVEKEEQTVPDHRSGFHRGPATASRTGWLTTAILPRTTSLHFSASTAGAISEGQPVTWERPFRGRILEFIRTLWRL